MEEIMGMSLNSEEVIKKFEQIQGVVQNTANIIGEAGKLSTLSFGQMAESLSRYSSAMWENSNAAKAMEIARTAMGVADEFANNGVKAGVDLLLEHIGAMTDNEAMTIGLETVRNAMGVADEFAANGVRAGIESLLEHIGAMTDNEAVTVGLEAMRSAMSAADFLANDGIQKSIDLVKEQITEFGNDAKTTLDLLDVRKSMTDEEGKFSIKQAASTAATVFNTAMKWQDILMSKKAVVQTGIETAKIIASGAKTIAVFVAKAAAGLGAIIMSAPFVGIALGAAAIAAVVAGVIALKSKMPAMATGGVVSSPTLALVGEGRYPEAVVPLGNSPQFSTMKEDIANAVLQGLSTISKTIQSKPKDNSEVVLKIDGANIARVLLPKMNDEKSRGKHTRREMQSYA